MKTYIYSKKRGEGKTSWLIDRIADAIAAGKKAYYVGSPNSFLNMRNRCHTEGIVGFEYLSEVTIPTGEFSVFTDELTYEAGSISEATMKLIRAYATAWFVTIAGEDIVQ